MSWDAYIDVLMKHDSIVDAAICGRLPGQEAVWASSPGGELGGITKEEIQKLVSPERSDLLLDGAQLAGVRCSLINDQLHDPICPFIQMKKTEGNLLFICVAATNEALVITKGKEKEPSQEQKLSTIKMRVYLKDKGF